MGTRKKKSSVDMWNIQIPTKCGFFCKEYLDLIMDRMPAHKETHFSVIEDVMYALKGASDEWQRRETEQSK